MKFSLLAAALVALGLTACGKPHQANPESIEGYGTRTEDGTTVAEERAAAGSEELDTSKFEMENAIQAEELAEKAAAAGAEAAEGAAGAVKDAADAVKDTAAEVEDEFSGKAVLPSHNLDGNGNPITDGKDPTKLMH